MNFFCLWIPQFPAWVLTQSEPELRTRPFAVCERGQVIAASASALEAGITVGMTTCRAQSRLNTLRLVPRDRNREALAWEEVQRTFYGLTPKIEAIAPGHLFAEVHPQQVSRLVHAWSKTGTVQGGAASNRASAHLAALSAPSGHVRVIKAGRENSFCDAFPLASLQGVGVAVTTITRLGWFGWKQVGQLRHLTRRQLEEQFGAEGKLLFEFAQGLKLKDNLRPVPQWTQPEEVVAALSFELPAREPAEWEGAIDLLLQRVCRALGTRQAQSLEVTAHTAIAPVTARRVLKEPLSQANSLRRPADAALEEALRTLAPLPPVVKGLEIRLGSLVNAPIQESLFYGDKEERIERPNRIKNALENIESRFAGRTGRFVPDQPHSPFPEEHFAWLSALEELKESKKAVPR